MPNLLIGYNGQVVLNDFFEYRFQPLSIPAPSLMRDLQGLVNNPDLSDVTFIVEGRPVYGSRVHLAARSEHFRAMLFGRMREASLPAGEGIEVEDVAHDVFVKMLEFLYTDDVADIPQDMAVPLLIAGERWMLPRLKVGLQKKCHLNSFPAPCIIPDILSISTLILI